MSQPQIDFAPLIRARFTDDGIQGLRLVSVEQRHTTLSVVFEGRSDTRSGRFGVRIRTPRHIGDERWRQFVASDDPEEWVSMIIPLEIVEPYETTALQAHALPDAEGVIWLTD
ncbi:hypothetical protein [Microbacterium sp. E-13]|uniref:hypothetical protein n=1 Tax=Microbacterium sp. E-13 TaxID=3404048 RepID=UPI003CEDC3C2